MTPPPEFDGMYATAMFLGAALADNTLSWTSRIIGNAERFVPVLSTAPSSSLLACSLSAHVFGCLHPCLALGIDWQQFAPSSIHKGHLERSTSVSASTAHGPVQYYHVVVHGHRLEDAALCYVDPPEHLDMIKDYVVFCASFRGDSGFGDLPATGVENGVSIDESWFG